MTTPQDILYSTYYGTVRSMYGGMLLESVRSLGLECMAASWTGTLLRVSFRRMCVWISRLHVRMFVPCGVVPVRLEWILGGEGEHLLDGWMGYYARIEKVKMRKEHMHTDEYLQYCAVDTSILLIIPSTNLQKGGRLRYVPTYTV